MATLQVKATDPLGITYSDPAVPGLTVRFRKNQTAKTLNGVSCINYTAEIIYNDQNAVTVSGVNVVDAVSVRLKTSGCAESMTRIGVLLTALAAQLTTWNTQHTPLGFLPTTAPVVPAA